MVCPFLDIRFHRDATSEWPAVVCAGSRKARRHLAAFEKALEQSSTPVELTDRMIAAYPDLANPYTLWYGAHDLLGART